MILLRVKIALNCIPKLGNTYASALPSITINDLPPEPPALTNPVGLQADTYAFIEGLKCDRDVHIIRLNLFAPFLDSNSSLFLNPNAPKPTIPHIISPVNGLPITPAIGLPLCAIPINVVTASFIPSVNSLVPSTGSEHIL